MTSGPRDWDAPSYDRVSHQMQQMGEEVLERLPLAGDETVLDAGCGTGRVTQRLISRLPRGHVIGVDGSPEMLRVARERLGPGPELLVQDLAQLDLGPGRLVDAILSTATFHWIPDHDALFGALARALRPGGRLEAQCGGVGNVASIRTAASVVGDRDPYASSLHGWDGPWNFSDPATAARRLRAAGFTDVRARLVERPVRPGAPTEYLRTIVLGSHLERLPEAQREPFLNEVAAALLSGDGRVTIDYVRLDLSATRA